jgi:hypothetical protein
VYKGRGGLVAMTATQEQLDRLVESFPITCTQCQTENDSRSKFCETCASPLKDYEFDLLHAPALADGRKWMGIVSVLYVVGGVLMAAISWSSDQVTAISILIVNLALAATQGGLWWWAKRATFAAAVASFALYVTLLLVEAVIDPASLFRGWLIKAFFIAALVKAIKAGLAVRRMRAEAQAAARHQITPA